MDRRVAGDSLRDILLSSVRSTGFWSFIAAVVGVVALATGGIIYLTIDELENFAITILVIGFALLFLALVLSPRAIAMFLIRRQGRYGANVVVITVAFFAIVVLVNFLFYRNTTRFDLTATRVFTLSPQTVQVLDSLDKPVRANAFFVPTDVRQGFVKQLAEDLMNEFERRAGKFTYRFIDPELNRTLALQYDVTNYPVIVFENVDVGTQEQIVRFTEQGFVTGILVVTGVEQKKVYTLTGHKESGISRDAATGAMDDEGFDFALLGMGRDNYIVRPLNLKQEDRVPDDAAVLVIAGPKQNLDASETEILMEYITQGGRIVALFDPDTPDSFVNLISQWGLTLGGLSVADAISNVGGALLTPLAQRANIQYFAPPDIRITDQIDITFFPGVTSVDPVLPAEEMPPFIRVVPLTLTTPLSWLESNVEDVDYDPEEDTLGPFYIAAAVEATGTVDETQRHPLARFVIFGDSDFAKNKFFSSSDNADLLLNSVNWLAEDYELISIRPKLIPFRGLVVNARERDFIKWSSWFFPPSLMVFLGVVVWWRRR